MTANGESSLTTLLATMQPYLHESPYVFCTLAPDIYSKLSLQPLCTFREQEGMTVILTQKQAGEYRLPCDTTWACITLRVYSSLSAVGFLAAIAGRLAQAGMPLNPVSAYYHDHLFVPWERKGLAMDILHELSSSQ